MAVRSVVPLRVLRLMQSSSDRVLPLWLVIPLPSQSSHPAQSGAVVAVPSGPWPCHDGSDWVEGREGRKVDERWRKGTANRGESCRQRATRLIWIEVTAAEEEKGKRERERDHSFPSFLLVGSAPNHRIPPLSLSQVEALAQESIWPPDHSGRTP